MKKIVLLTAVSFLSLNVFSQLKIGNNPTTINSNSILELESTNKGLLIPRVALQSTDNAAPLSSFVAGMMIYNTATAGDVTPGFYVSTGSSWSKIDDPNTTYTGSTSVTLNGTSFERAALTGDVTAAANSNSTTISNNAVTYAKMQNVSANNRILGRATTGAGTVEEITLGSGLTLSGTTLSASSDLRLVNTASHITQDAGVGSNGTSAGSNESIMIGQGAGNSNSGERNIFIGYEAGYSNTTPTEQIYIGYKAGRANTTGTKNTLIGSLNGTSFTTGSHNTAVGHNNLLNNTTGNLNSAFGSGSLAYNTSSNNTAIGGSAMVFNTGTGNTALGALAMVNGNSSGSFNTAIGSESGFSLTGNSNTLLGFRSGSNLTSGNRNILIGETIQAPSNTGSNQLSIGNLIFGTNVDGSGTTLSSGNIGIGVAAPSEKLEVGGAIRFSGALMPNNTAGTAGQVLTSSGAGAVPTWTTLPTATTYTGSTSVTLNGTSFERAALTGDVTASLNSNATTIANDAVTYAKMQNISANNTLLGRATTGAGDVEEITLGTGLSLTGTTLNATTANTIYSADGTLSGNRIVTQGTNTLGFTSSASTGTSHFTIDGTTLNVDAVNNRIGVGTATPTFPLHVASSGANAGRFEMNSTNSTVGGVSTIELINTNNLIGNYTSIAGKASSGGFSASMEFVNTNGSHLSPIGDIRFVTNNNGTITEKLRILGNGGIRASSLAGTGSRMVVADASGNLSTQTIPSSTTYTGSSSVALNGTSFERAALTGDVTASLNSNATTIANDAVTYAKMQNISANNTLLGRATTGAGDVEEITLGTGLSLSGTTLNAATATTLYNGDGSLSGNRTVTQGVNTLSFTSTVTNGFSVDGGTFSVDAANNRIGLGTTSPVDALHVEATGGKRLVFSNSGGITNNEDIGGITWRQDDGTGTIMGNIVIQGNSGSTGDGSSRMSIGTRANLAGTGLVETMSIHSNGNVGINTGSAAPTEKLHVVGNIRSSSLAGTGSRMVVADANGVMSTTAIPTATNYSGSTSVALNGTSFERAALTGDVTAAANSNALTIANDAVTTVKIADGAITAAKLNQMAATTGQILKWNGTAWAPAADDNSTADGSETKLTAGSGITISGTGTTASPYVINANSSVATVTADYTATSSNNTILCNVPGAGMTLTLPSASANTGKVIVIRKIDNDRDVLTFSPALNYSTSQTISTLNFVKTITVQSNGTAWWVISE